MSKLWWALGAAAVAGIGILAYKTHQEMKREEEEFEAAMEDMEETIRDWGKDLEERLSRDMEEWANSPEMKDMQDRVREAMWSHEPAPSNVIDMQEVREGSWQPKKGTG